MDNGCIEIGNIMTQAPLEVIRKLKSILDQHGIFHISDGVEFNKTSDQAACNTLIHPDQIGAADKPQGNFYLQICRLIVPDLYALNFMSLINLNSDEADFLAALIYGEHLAS